MKRAEKTFFETLTDKLKRYQTRSVTYSGFLGKSDGTVEVPGLSGYVYIRMVNGEVLTAFNQRVPNIFDLPVYFGYDPAAPKLFQVLSIRPVFVTQPNQDTSLPEIPDHSHTWPARLTTWVRGEQFLPGLVQAKGGMIVCVYPFYLRKLDGTHIYVPYTELDLTSYIPLDGSVAVLVAVDDDGDFVITSSASVASVEAVDESIIPISEDYSLAGVRLSFGVSSIRQEEFYNDIFDLRFGRSVGGGGTPGGSDTDIQFNNAGAFGGVGTFRRQSNGSIVIGDIDPSLLIETYSIAQGADGASIANFLESFGVNVASYIAFLRARGTHDAPTAVLAEDVLGRIRGRGHDGSGWTSTRAEIRIVADGDWSAGDHPARFEIWTCPDGSGTLTLAMTIGSDGHAYLEDGKEYRVNGAQHAHDASDITSGTMATARLGSGTADNGKRLAGDSTWVSNTAYALYAHLFSQTIPASSTRYTAPFFINLLDTVERAMPVLRAGVIKNFYVRKINGQPASGSLVVHVRNLTTGVNIITITIPAGETGFSTKTELSTSVSVSAGDQIGFKFENNATAASCAIGYIGVEFEAT